MRHLVAKFVRWVGGHETGVLVGALVVVVGSWAFILLAAVVSNGSTLEIDEAILRSLRQSDDSALLIGPAWLHEVARDITALGGYAFLILLVTSVYGFLRLDRKYFAMWFMLIAISSGYVMSLVLKGMFSRPRPDVVPHLAYVNSSSFPSGHSMMSAVVFLTLGALLTRMVSSQRLKFYFLFVALLLTGLVGASRVYVGVHYPSDVLAGWTAGLVWATLCSLVALRMQRRGTIEAEL